MGGAAMRAAGQATKPLQVRAVVVGVGDYTAWERRLCVPIGRFSTPLAVEEAQTWALSMRSHRIWGKVDLLVPAPGGAAMGLPVRDAPTRAALDSALASLCADLPTATVRPVVVLAGRGAWYDPGDGGGGRPWFCPSDTRDIAFDGIDVRRLYARLCAAAPDRPVHLALRCGFGVEGRSLTPGEQVLEPIVAVRPGDVVTTLRPPWDPTGVTPGGLSVDAGIA